MSHDPRTEVSADVRHRAARVRLACFDVDGVMTDGRLAYTEAGAETKTFHAHDGLGLQLLRENGFEVALITARSSPQVARRAQELSIARVYQGEKDKLARLNTVARDLGVALEAVAYMGDDLPDLACLARVGLAIAPANAHPWVLERVHWKTLHAGGDGAVREVCDLLVAAHGRAATAVARYLPT
jgi:3-deoxy-D-manno-octulosonate 8-phosphate phosphatase (KDO 8-P phosphatase)